MLALATIVSVHPIDEKGNVISVGTNTCIFLKEVPFTTFFQFCQETVKYIDMVCKGDAGLVG